MVYKIWRSCQACDLETGGLKAAARSRRGEIIDHARKQIKKGKIKDEDEAAYVASCLENGYGVKTAEERVNKTVSQGAANRR